MRIARISGVPDEGTALRIGPVISAVRKVSVHATKEQAVDSGRDLARIGEVKHLIHNVDGTNPERNGYGSNSYPPAG